MKNSNEHSVDISVCVANYNGGAYVLECLESIYAQKGDFNIEVIVHDDFSEDDSLASITSSYPQALILTSDKNVGFCISNNRMIAVSSGRYLLLFNNDAVMRPGTLSALFNYARDEHQEEVVGLPQHAMIDGKLMDCGYRTDLFLTPAAIIEASTHEVGVATGACLWIPRKIWNAVGGFPEWFESIAEDIYFCFATRLLGFRVVVLQNPGFDHWIGRNLGGGKLIEQRLSTTVRRRALSERNRTYTIFLCYPLPALLLTLPFHFMALVMEAFFLLLLKTPGEKIKKIYYPIPKELWRHRSQIATLRKHLMGQRRASFKYIFAQTVLVPQKLRLLWRHGKPTLK